MRTSKISDRIGKYRILKRHLFFVETWFLKTIVLTILFIYTIGVLQQNKTLLDYKCV